MKEDEIFEKLKDALDYEYLCTDFGETEVKNIEEYLRAIKYERTIEKEHEFEASERMKTYQEFIHYLNDRAVGETHSMIEAVDSNTYNRFKGYIKANMIVKKNKLFLEFEVDGCKLTAEWQAWDNYGVWQKCGNLGDDYYGYLLFPTYNEGEYFCLEFSC